MPSLAPGARQLPLRHLSIRIPWNDNAWTGVMCHKPSENVSYLILKRISAAKNDFLEDQVAGQPWEELREDQLPPCKGERGDCMAPYERTRMLEHPYASSSDTHRHFLPTPFRFPAFSAACIPFRWTLKAEAETRADELELGYQHDLEADAHEKLPFPTSWLQTKHNQLVLLDTFFSAVEPEKSLCFFYAKKTPLIDDPRRVIVGVGRVKHVGPPTEYRYSNPGEHTSILWERAVQHSIRPRPNLEDGFLLPYHELVTYLSEHPVVP